MVACSVTTPVLKLGTLAGTGAGTFGGEGGLCDFQRSDMIFTFSPSGFRCRGNAR